MKKKTVKPDRICFECLHYEACQSWNIGSLVKTAADNCVNYRASVNRGKNVTEENPVDQLICSECGLILEGYHRRVIDDDEGFEIYYEFKPNFCPSCGADMRGEKDV